MTTQNTTNADYFTKIEQIKQNGRRRTRAKYTPGTARFEARLNGEHEYLVGALGTTMRLMSDLDIWVDHSEGASAELREMLDQMHEIAGRVTGLVEDAAKIDV